MRSEQRQQRRGPPTGRHEWNLCRAIPTLCPTSKSTSRTAALINFNIVNKIEDALIPYPIQIHNMICRRSFIPKVRWQYSKDILLHKDLAELTCHDPHMGTEKPQTPSTMLAVLHWNEGETSLEGSRYTWLGEALGGMLASKGEKGAYLKIAKTAKTDPAPDWSENLVANRAWMSIVLKSPTKGQ